MSKQRPCREQNITKENYFPPKHKRKYCIHKIRQGNGRKEEKKEVRITIREEGRRKQRNKEKGDAERKRRKNWRTT